MKREKGIVVGSDRNHEWLLPWWWDHYVQSNSFPVQFADFGMSEEAVVWCLERGELFKVPPLPFSIQKRRLSSKTKKIWEKRYGQNIWLHRSAWLRKPLALLQSSFEWGLWIDLDCEIRGKLDPLFETLTSGVDLAIALESVQDSQYLFPEEILYNAGVIAFRAGSSFLSLWMEAMTRFDLPTDQEYLSRIIYLYELKLMPFLPIYNWFRTSGENEEALIHHYCGGTGKIEILKKIGPAAFYQADAPKIWKRISKEAGLLLDSNAHLGIYKIRREFEHG